LKQFTAVTQANQKPAFVNVLIIQIMHNGSQKVQSLSIWVILEDVSNSFFTFGRLFETDEILAAEDILCGNILYMDLLCEDILCGGIMNQILLNSFILFFACFTVLLFSSSAN